MKPNFKKYDKHTIRKVFRLWNKGLTQRQIAREIGISRSTVIYIREKYHFRQNRYAGLDTKLIRLKQYEKMNERELQFILWVMRLMKIKCEDHMYRRADELNKIISRDVETMKKKKGDRKLDVNTSTKLGTAKQGNKTKDKKINVEEHK